VPYTVDTKLVRGLDYYEHVCFEFMNSDGLSVISGGRYDSLAAAIGHKSTVPGIGWAAGVDRIANAMEESW